MTIGEGYSISNTTINNKRHSSLINLLPVIGRPRVVATYAPGDGAVDLRLGLANSQSFDEDRDVLREFLISTFKTGMRNKGSAVLIFQSLFPGDEPDYSIVEEMKLKIVYSVEVRHPVSQKVNYMNISGAESIHSYLNSVNGKGDGDLVITSFVGLA